MRLLAAVVLGLVAAALPAAAEIDRDRPDPDAVGLRCHARHPDRSRRRLYIKTHASDLPAGVTINLVTRDDTGPNPEVAKRLAQELVTRGIPASHRQRLYAQRAGDRAHRTAGKVPFVVLNAATASIPRSSPYIVRDSFTLWQTAMPLGKWAAEQGAKTAYTAVSDYAPGWDAEHAFAKGFTEGGGKMVGSVRFPLTNLNFMPYLQRVADQKPQYRYIFVPVGSAVDMMRAVTNLNSAAQGHHPRLDHGHRAGRAVPDMGDTTLGLVTSGNYSAVATRPQNKAFVAAWKREYGPDALPDFTGVQGWDSMAAIFAVLKATGGKFDGDKAMAVLDDWKDPNSPRGPISINPATRDVIENIYLRRVEKVDGKLANVEFATIPDQGSVEGEETRRNRRRAVQRRAA